MSETADDDISHSAAIEDANEAYRLAGENLDNAVPAWVSTSAWLASTVIWLICGEYFLALVFCMLLGIPAYHFYKKWSDGLDATKALTRKIKRKNDLRRASHTLNKGE